MNMNSMLLNLSSLDVRNLNQMPSIICQICKHQVSSVIVRTFDTTERSEKLLDGFSDAIKNLDEQGEDEAEERQPYAVVNVQCLKHRATETYLITIFGEGNNVDLILESLPSKCFLEGNSRIIDLRIDSKTKLTKEMKQTLNSFSDGLSEL
jgi:hypothetical protein